MAHSLQPHGLCDPTHTRCPCPSLSPRVCSDSSRLSRWCHPNMSSSVAPFSSCPQSFLAKGSFPISQLFSSGGQSIGDSASASVLPVNIQDWFPLGSTGLISLQSKGLPRVFSSTITWKHQFFGAQPPLWSNSHIHTWLLEKPSVQLTQLCPTLCDPMDCSTPSFPVLHYLQEFAQIHSLRVGDAIQPMSSSVIPFSSCLQSLPASGSFPMSQFFTSGGQSIGASSSASAFPMNIQDWFPLGSTGLISLQSKRLSRVSSNSTIQKHQFFGAQLSLWFNSHIHTWLLEKS